MFDTTGLRFEQALPAPATLANRADVACFIGFVPRSQKFRDRLPEPVRAWLLDQGLIGVPGAPSEFDAEGRPTPRVVELLQLPVPIDSWSTFVDLFEPRGRPLRDGSRGFATTYLAAAVRSFFLQGGRKCFVLRVGDPVRVDAPRSTRLDLIGELLPQWAGNLAALSPTAPERWLGISHLYDLDEVSFVCFPDLPWLVGEDTSPGVLAPRARESRDFHVDCSDPDAVPAEPAIIRRESFVECAEPEPPERHCIAKPTGAPRLTTRAGYQLWGQVVNTAAQFLRGRSPARSRKDVQLIVSVPMPAAGTDADTDLLHELLEADLLEPLEAVPHGLSSAHVQLTYPWLGWSGSAELPEGLEPPDGALAGLLARGTLLEGTFRSFADQRLRHVERLEPALSLAQQARLQPRGKRDVAAERFLSLRQRVSLFGFGLDGVELLADVTTSSDEAWRPANVNRLMSIWVRALARAGEDFLFEPMSQLTLGGLRHRLQFIGESLFKNGALRGRNPQEAFLVRCDQSTISRTDADNGRIIAEIQFRPAVPLEGILISLALDEARGISARSEVA